MHERLEHIIGTEPDNFAVHALVLQRALARLGISGPHRTEFPYEVIDFSFDQLKPLQKFLKQQGLHVHTKAGAISALVVPSLRPYSLGSVHLYPKGKHLETRLMHPAHGTTVSTLWDGSLYLGYGPLAKIIGLEPLHAYAQLALQLDLLKSE